MESRLKGQEKETGPKGLGCPTAGKPGFSKLKVKLKRITDSSSSQKTEKRTCLREEDVALGDREQVGERE